MTRNQTELALIARGVNVALAKTLREGKWTLAKLQQQSHQQLIDLGLNDEAVRAMRGTGRPPIPTETLVKTLFANRWVCCVCRNANLPVIVHHIEAWAESHDHSEKNLAVLCSIHHGEAHTVRTLEQNLTVDRLREMKVAWEKKVGRLDTSAIFTSTQLMACQWWYFNHLRIFEISRAHDVDLTQLDGFQGARSANLCDDNGVLHESAGSMYRASAALILQHYMTNMLQVALGNIRVQNISDDLDRGTLKCLIAEGELIFVQGSYTFSDLPPSALGDDWVSGRRHVNGIEISFIFNRNEGTSGSARNLWLRGTQNLGCLLRVNRLHKDLKGRLQIKATVLAIRSAHEELKSRLYEMGLYLSGLIGRVDKDDDDFEDDEFECEEDEEPT
ncbi:HNH endonuclease [Pseudomonas aeruginosa]|nr:HNH endonuclease [Pseudomonas aeruginosa]